MGFTRRIRTPRVRPARCGALEAFPCPGKGSARFSCNTRVRRHVFDEMSDLVCLFNMRSSVDRCTFYTLFLCTGMVYELTRLSKLCLLLGTWGWEAKYFPVRFQGETVSILIPDSVTIFLMKIVTPCILNLKLQAQKHFII